LANCLPMPLEAPVIMITWSLKFIVDWVSGGAADQIGLEASRAA